MFWGVPVSAGRVGQGVQGRLGAPAAFAGLGQDVLGGAPHICGQFGVRWARHTGDSCSRIP